MDAAERSEIVDALRRAFGAAEDTSLGPDQILHVLLPRVELPEPWQPSPAKAMTIWEGWPAERPRFLVDYELIGENGEPPRSNEDVLVHGETWRGFSFSFPWSGSDPVRVVQLWMERFRVERA